MSAPTSDADSAKAAMEKISENLRTVCAVMDDLQQQGMQVQFQLGKNSFGHNVIASINVVRVVA